MKGLVGKGSQLVISDGECGAKGPWWAVVPPVIWICFVFDWSSRYDAHLHEVMQYREGGEPEKGPRLGAPCLSLSCLWHKDSIKYVRSWKELGKWRVEDNKDVWFVTKTLVRDEVPLSRSRWTLHCRTHLKKIGERELTIIYTGCGRWSATKCVSL